MSSNINSRERISDNKENNKTKNTVQSKPKTKISLSLKKPGISVSSDILLSNKQWSSTGNNMQQNIITEKSKDCVVHSDSKSLLDPPTQTINSTIMKYFKIIHA